MLEFTYTLRRQATFPDADDNDRTAQTRLIRHVISDRERTKAIKRAQEKRIKAKALQSLHKVPHSTTTSFCASILIAGA